MKTGSIQNTSIFENSTNWVYHQFCQLKTSDSISQTVQTVFFALAPCIAVCASVYFAYRFVKQLHPVPPLPSAEEKNIQNLRKEFTQLQDDYNTIFAGIKGIFESEGDAWHNRCVDLKPKLASTPELSVTYARLIAMETEFNALRQHREMLKHIPPTRIDDEGRIPIPDQGNCFHEAALKGYSFYKNCNNTDWDTDDDREGPIPTSPEFCENATELRQQLIQWERDNLQSDDQLRAYVGIGIDTYLQDMEKKIREHQASIAFFEQEKAKASQLKQKLDALEDGLRIYLQGGIDTNVQHMEEKIQELQASIIVLKEEQGETAILEQELEDLKKQLSAYLEMGIDTNVQSMEEEIRSLVNSISALVQDNGQVNSLKDELEALEKQLAPFKELSGENLIQHYFNQASQEGFWATIAECYAFAKQADVCLTVRRQVNGKELVKEQQVFNHDSKRKITIWHINNNHFELRMEQD